MSKYYSRPNHIVDTCFVFFLLDGNELRILRIPISASMVLDPNSFDHLKDFKEVSGHELTELSLKYASKQSIEKFKEDYYNLYLKHGKTKPYEVDFDLSKHKPWEEK